MVPTLKTLRRLFESQERISTEEALEIIHKALDVMDTEPNVLEIAAPVVVYGDLHGQFFDLMKMLDKIEYFEENQENSNRKLLFLGDYVDRGAFSCEVILFLLCMKIHRPNNVYLLRGNHECEAISSFYGFRLECKAKYGVSVYFHFIKCFQSLPLAAVLDAPEGRIFCVHGGLSPEIETISDIQSLDRRREPSTSGPLCDLLWSDPIPEYESEITPNSSLDQDDEDLEPGTLTNYSVAHSFKESFREVSQLSKTKLMKKRPSIVPETAKWSPNEVRGCSYYYGCLAVYAFLNRNDLLCMLRAHELQDEGFLFHFSSEAYLSLDTRKDTTFPPVITLFSAPHYCDEYNNLGAMMFVPDEPHGFDVEQIHPVRHPRPRKHAQSEGMWTMFESTLPYISPSTKFFEEMAELNNVDLTTKPKKLPSFQASKVGLELEEDIIIPGYTLTSTLTRSRKYLPLLVGAAKLKRRRSSERHPHAANPEWDAITSQWKQAKTKSDDIIVSSDQSKVNLAVIFTTKELEMLKLMFTLIDVDGDFVLQSDEIARFIERILMLHITEEKAIQYTKALDCNKDGQVDLADLIECAAKMKRKYYQQQESRLRWKEWQNFGCFFVTVILLYCMRTKRPWCRKKLLWLPLTCLIYWYIQRRNRKDYSG
ncbi:serine/threonine-protein phosphatase 2B catalytic subunit [Thraustotheca clavata]|uniref:Serine/threonine-protein phosphatase n=1 Tax=Thraustotheca clavata TaxID=74557 RepID=A0A1V9ZY56_9STRA|nr:serine/threonine-protein phosphatase 2B catalytic subunit [Thraustotheca clavata]